MKFILTADWHLRGDRPRCRIDEDWFETQRRTITGIANFANERGVPVCIVGDIFDRSVVPEKIKILFLNFAASVKSRILNLKGPASVFCLAGNHDLPYHSWNNMKSSSFGVIWSSDIVQHLNILGKAAHFGEEMTGEDNGIVFLHQLTFPNVKLMPPNTEALTAQDLLDIYPDAKWIFTGDYHKAFHYKKDGRHVVNPGCILIQEADMIDYLPGFYFIDTEEEVVEHLFIPQDDNVVTDSHLRAISEKETRISAFIEAIQNPELINLDFVANVKTEMKKNDMSKDAKNVVMELLEQ